MIRLDNKQAGYTRSFFYSKSVFFRLHQTLKGSSIKRLSKVPSKGFRGKKENLSHTLHIYITIFSFIAFILITSFGNAQTINDLSYLNKEKLKQADEFYNLLEFNDALRLYLEINRESDSDTAILCRIGNSYRMLNEHTKAEEWYRKAVVNNAPTIALNYKLLFAQELATNGKYNEALFWFKEYSKFAVKDQRALASIKSIENLSSFFNDTLIYSTFPVAINTEHAEFCPVYYKNEVLFLSNRKNPKSGYLDLYTASPDDNGLLTKSLEFDNQIKTQYNEGPLVFYDSNSKVIFSQNYYSDKLSKKQVNEISLQLFMADVNDNGKWTNIQLLPFANNNFSYTQPSVSTDAQTLYFSSNVEGGFGGTDLYKSEFRNGEWGIPVNLGKTINTSGNEMFPFIYNDSVLFFSSNGHGGLGGLDIVKINLTKQSKIEPIGYPINSRADDFGVIIDQDGLEGYLASNRSGGSGGDDIYGFNIIRKAITVKIIEEDSKNPVSGVGIYTTDDEQIGLTDEDGVYSMLLPVIDVVAIKVKKDDYESKTYTIEPYKKTKKDLEVISIKSTPKEIVVLKDDNDQMILNQGSATYKVQFFASRRKPSKQELRRKYKGNMKIHSFYEDNWYKYSIGEFYSYAAAKKLLIDSKVHDAFIIAYVDNKKVNIVIAKKETRETNVEAFIR